MTGRLVVGINGNAASAAALDWAIRWATRHSMRLEVCTALGEDWFVDPDGYFRQAHQRVLDEARAHIERVAPKLRTTFVLHRGETIDVLAELSAHADLTVVGSRKAGIMTGVVRGTMALRLATRARGPLVAVPENWAPHGAKVVVGTDDETDSDAIRFAARAAADESTELLLVHAIEQPVYYTPYDFGGRPELLEEERRLSMIDLAAHQRTLLGEYHDLEIACRVEEGNPSLVLVRNATGASLAVVGSHHRNAVVGFLVGSVGHDLLMNVPCPVAIIPPHSDATAADDDLALTTSLAL